MSTSCPSAFEFSCPEIVPVTVNQTIVQIEDSPAMHRTQRFRYGNVDDGTFADNRTLPLSRYPYEPNSVLVVRNTGVQRNGIDYTVQGQYVVLNEALVDANDEVYVTYLSVEGTVASQGATPGAIVAAAGSSLGATGEFLRMDGTNPHNWTSYGALKTYFWDTDTPITRAADEAASGGYSGAAATRYSRRSTLLVNNYTATAFTLVSLQDVSYNGETLVTLNKFIKT